MFATADLIDAHEAVLQSCDLRFRDFGGHARFHGPIRTVACREDNVLARATLSQSGNGGVLVAEIIAGLAIGGGIFMPGTDLYADEDGIVVSERVLEIIEGG